MGGGVEYERGNWIKDSMRRDADYETETGRGRRMERERETEQKVP